MHDDFVHLEPYADAKGTHEMQKLEVSCTTTKCLFGTGRCSMIAMAKEFFQVNNCRSVIPTLPESTGLQLPVLPWASEPACWVPLHRKAVCEFGRKGLKTWGHEGWCSPPLFLHLQLGKYRQTQAALPWHPWKHIQPALPTSKRHFFMQELPCITQCWAEHNIGLH